MVLMKSLATLLFLLPTWSALASEPPGPPPWACRAIEACNDENTCARLYGVPLGFNLRNIEKEENRFVAEGYNRIERIAMLLSNMEDAQRFVETDSSQHRVSIILIRNDRLADAHGFWAYSTYETGSGERHIFNEKMLISCHSIRER